MTGNGSRIITALETVWGDIQRRHPEVPDVVVITGTAKQAGGDRWGHHWPDRWYLADGSEQAPELLIAGELLAKGAARVLETMLHEAAHAVAHVRGVKDTSRGGRYHNRQFAQLAEELGLARPRRPSTNHGLSFCTITPQIIDAYADTIQALDNASIAHLQDIYGTDTPTTNGEDGQDGTAGPGGDTDSAGTGRGGRRRAVECGCQPPRRIQLTLRAIEDGPVLCGVCHHRFEPVATGG